MFDAEQEDREDAAIRVMQRRARLFIAKLKLIKLTRSQYIKKYDRINDIYYYKNKTSGAILSDKPICLGMSDLPDPRDFEAPEGYDAQDDDSPVGFALVVVNDEFPSSGGRLAKLSAVCMEEYFELEDLFTHEFICKYQTENTYFLRNCTCQELKDTFERLKRNAKKKNFFTLYICTHVLTVVGGDPKLPSETAYFAMRESVFTKPELITKTCVSLTQLTAMMNKLPCKKKTILVNYAHVNLPPPTFFAPVKSIYPPTNFLSRLCEMTDSAVIASCASGFSMSDALKHGDHRLKAAYQEVEAGKKDDKKDRKEEKNENTPAGEVTLDADGTPLPDPPANEHGEKKEGGLHEHSHAAHDHEQNPKNGDHDDHHHNHHDNQEKEGKAEEEEHDSEGEDGRDYENEDFMTALGGGFNHHAHLHDAAVSKKRVLPSNPTQVLVESYLSYWAVPEDPPIHVTDRPPRPLAVWKRDEETNNEFEVTLPTEDDIHSHSMSLVMWRLRRALRPPVNFIKKKYRMYLRRHLYAPQQKNIILPNEQFSVFGDGLCRAIRGGSHKPGKKQVTVKMIYEFIKDYVPKKIAEYKKEANNQLAKQLSNTLQIMALGDSEADGWMSDADFEIMKADIKQKKDALNAASFAQSPVLFIPTNNPKSGKNPVCFRCGPPAAPEKPYIVRTGINDIALEWYDQPFDGIPPFKYSVEMRSKTRVFYQWQVAPSPGDITTTTFIVRDLPSGVAVQFRVRGFNNGGWSQYSEPTQPVTPGDSLTPMPTSGRWRRVVQGGSLAIIDVLLSRPMNRGEHIIGLRKLLALVTEECGFKKQNIQLKVAHAAVHGLITFVLDPEIARVAFVLLGWCMKDSSPGFKKVRIYLRKMDISKICTEYMLNGRFRLDTGIMTAIEFFRTMMPAQGQAGAISMPPDIDIPDESNDVNMDDDEEEERKAIEEDVRKEEQRLKQIEDDREFLERTAKIKAAEEAKAAADEMAKKKAEKKERERERAKAANKYK